MVQPVEKLYSKLDPLFFGDGKRLECGQIPVLEPHVVDGETISSLGSRERSRRRCGEDRTAIRIPDTEVEVLIVDTLRKTAIAARNHRITLHFPRLQVGTAG